MLGLQMDSLSGEAVDGSAPEEVGSVDERCDTFRRGVDVFESDGVARVHYSLQVRRVESVGRLATVLFGFATFATALPLPLAVIRLDVAELDRWAYSSTRCSKEPPGRSVVCNELGG